jgi:endoglucanase
VLWDNGADFLDRSKGVWRDAVAKDIYISAAKGVKNSLPESTVDTKAATQETSAYLFHKVGQAVSSQTLSFQLNGNTIKGVKLENGPALPVSDYQIEGPTIKFSNAFLGRCFSPTATPGVKASLIIQFSAGADSCVELVQWNVPQLKGEASSKAVNGKDLSIPISWKGISKVATVKAVFEDGKYLVDDWTQWLGPLQQARAVCSSFPFFNAGSTNLKQTYSNHWNWDAANLIISKGAIGAVVQAKKRAVFTFEFWPRVPGNSVNYTLTV